MVKSNMSSIQHPSATDTTSTESGTKKDNPKTKKTRATKAKRPTAKTAVQKTTPLSSKMKRKRKRDQASALAQFTRKTTPTKAAAARRLFGLNVEPENEHGIAKLSPETGPSSDSASKVTKVRTGDLPTVSKSKKRRLQKIRRHKRLATENKTLRDSARKLAKSTKTNTTPPLPHTPEPSYTGTKDTAQILKDFIDFQTTAMKAQREDYTTAMAASNTALKIAKTHSPHSKSQHQGYKLNTNPKLIYSTEFESQLECDVFFQDVDASIIAASSQGHLHFRGMLKNAKAHPFYRSGRLRRVGPKILGKDFVFDHTIHNDRKIIAKIGRRHSSLAKHLTNLIEKGDQLSWEIKNSVIHQYYRAALPSTLLFYLTMVPENNGLALRHLMITHAQTLQFHDAKLATINSGKIIRAIQYSTKTGLLKYFGTLTSELRALAKVGMQIKPNTFAELDLIGHIFDHLTAKSPTLAAKIKWIRDETEVNRYELSLPAIKLTLLHAERLARAHDYKTPQVNGLQGNSLNTGERSNNRRNQGGRNNNDTPPAWKQTYPADVITPLVMYAKKRYLQRLKDQGMTVPTTEPECFNCAKGISIHKRKRRRTGHPTAKCFATLIRAYNGFTAQGACNTHPDGCHPGSKCTGGKPPRVNKVSPTTTAAYKPATSSSTKAATPGTAEEQIQIMMALPVSLRSAYAAALADDE